MPYSPEQIRKLPNMNIFPIAAHYARISRANRDGMLSKAEITERDAANSELAARRLKQ